MYFQAFMMRTRSKGELGEVGRHQGKWKAEGFERKGILRAGAREPGETLSVGLASSYIGPNEVEIEETAK